MLSRSHKFTLNILYTFEMIVLRLKSTLITYVACFQYAILLTVVLHILVKYTLHSVDLQSENPWDNKAVYLLYTELILGKFNNIK